MKTIAPWVAEWKKDLAEQVKIVKETKAILRKRHPDGEVGAIRKTQWKLETTKAKISQLLLYRQCMKHNKVFCLDPRYDPRYSYVIKFLNDPKSRRYFSPNNKILIDVEKYQRLYDEHKKSTMAVKTIVDLVKLDLI